MKTRDPYKKADEKRFKTKNNRQRRQARDNKRSWE